MTAVKGVLGVACAVAVTTGIFGVAQYRSAGELESAIIASRQQQAATEARIASLAEDVRRQSERARAVEEDNATLKVALEKAESAKVVTAAAAPTSVNRQTVEERYQRGRELAKKGDPAEALRELLWCFDTGMPQISSYAGVRTSFLLSQIMELSRTYPAALTALRERRDVAQQRLLAGKGDALEAPDLVALNRALGETKLTLAVYDQLPPEDRVRHKLRIFASEVLLEHRRYQDVLAGTSYATMRSTFELAAQDRPVPATATQPERLRAAQRQHAITSAAKNVEVLAGAGELDHARALAERVLAYDETEGTRTLLRQHAARAGHPALFGPTVP